MISLPAATRLPVPTNWLTKLYLLLLWLWETPARRRNKLDAVPVREWTAKDAELRMRNNMNKLWNGDNVDFVAMRAEFLQDSALIYEVLDELAAMEAAEAGAK